MIRDDASRIALGISYVGSNYRGLQRLKQLDSITSRLEASLGKIANHPIKLYAAGRTDKGVHALQQVVHFDTHAARDEYKWCAGSNAHLPADIRVHWAQPVTSAFHARFSAQSRRYAYLIAHCKWIDAAMQRVCYSLHQPLDLAAMRAACALVQGEYDCTAFTTHSSLLRSPGKSPFRQIDWLAVYSSPPWILIDIQANAFLHRMVRMMVAELLQVGLGVVAVDHLQTLLNSAQPRAKKITVPAQGLFLAAIGYPSVWNLPLQAVENLWPYRLTMSGS